MKRKSRLIIASGPSGSGKTSTMRAIMKNEITSFTTRPPRSGEVDGVDYIFISPAEFEELLNNNGLAEHTTYYGSASYGITMDELVGKLDSGDAFVVVDIVGKEQLEALYPNTVSIFFDISLETAIERMKSRGDTDEMVEKRLKTFREELENFYLYDYVVDNNGDFSDTVEAVKYILEIEENRDVCK